MAMKPSRALAALIAAGSLSLVLVSQPAMANGDCNTQSSKTKISTTAKTTNGACKVQARIYRYVSSYPTAYLGPIGTVSTVTATVGTEAGHSTRTYYGGGWSWWYNF